MQQQNKQRSPMAHSLPATKTLTHIFYRKGADIARGKNSFVAIHNISGGRGENFYSSPAVLRMRTISPARLDQAAALPWSRRRWLTKPGSSSKALQHMETNSRSE